MIVDVRVTFLFDIYIYMCVCVYVYNLDLYYVSFLRRILNEKVT